MKTAFTAAFAALLTLSSLSAVACPGDKAKDDGKQMSTPAKPKA